MKNHHILIALCGDAKEQFDARELVRSIMEQVGARAPFKIWGNAGQAEGVVVNANYIIE